MHPAGLSHIEHRLQACEKVAISERRLRIRTEKTAGEKRMPDNHHFDWARFVVHFIFGALLGALAGFTTWFLWFGREPYGWLVIAAPAVAIGLLAGFFGDRFWESFREPSWWNPFTWWWW
jgi:hypothetical protein